MKKNKYDRSGTVGGGIVLLLIVGSVVLAIVRGVWLNSANDYYDSLISFYISQPNDHEPEDQDKLKARLLEEGIFIKMHRWDKEDFVKDKELYEEMINTRQKWERDKERQGSVMEDLINL